jgi:hypothetical protein
MSRLIPFLLACAALLVAQGSRGDVPAKDNNAPQATPFAGKWKVEFTNGVAEQCRIGIDGEASVKEPLRRSQGRAVYKGGSLVVTFKDDRVERWTPVGKLFVVEHWFPGSGFPTATPVLGIAERAP